MPENFLELTAADRAEALEAASAQSGRPSYLLEKDVWVVWALGVITARFGERLVFKGGTSLSKAYGAIDRFSEDIDLTYDIRHLLQGEDGLEPGIGDGLPPSGARARKWTEKVRQKLPEWIEGEVKPLFEDAISGAGLEMTLRQATTETLHIDYRPTANGGTNYVKPAVMLEFGARSTGEPAEQITITCDAAPHLLEVSFPTASPRVMALERTFWEKATAAHVYCVQADLRGERFARHWHDLAALARHSRYRNAVDDRGLAEAVARHKAVFFKAKDPSSGDPIDYCHAVRGNIRIVPQGDAAKVLEEDYVAMRDAGLLHGTAVSFADLMASCQAIEQAINAPVQP
ncbi:nucleotidyl transferase AbiEii/AbiGii toxin family protein [Roseomonas sp. 18066]|uniref:nucleotidyl transferase AbiEii/AbiGii toxin family protein n=1 Tax=Roseomonas sp. 18066 TaxID=2681412 RepID=UPI00135B342A|nr:nucleotidyl transferase AbiEii/AbiGii toxin family protein [Roseomonas sp. 18066]